ncbi:MAG: aspartyl/asparaginyl beta-hydroxylase domain-containing protein [Xanthobacteraceae bacterium]
MSALPATVRLLRTFDQKPLLEEIERVVDTTVSLPAGVAVGQVDAGLDRGWMSITVYPTPAPVNGSQRLSESQLLRSTPRVLAALESLRCPIQRVRIQSLEPKGVIHEHTDAMLGFADGLIRMHVPVVTNPDVYSYIDGQRCIWRAGELWYGDFSLPHKAENRGDTTRRHLIIDAYVDDLTLMLFPPELQPRIRTLMQPNATQAPRADFQPYLFNFRLPAGVDLPGIGASAQPIHGSVCPIGGRLMLVLNQEPQFSLVPQTISSLSILGLATPVVIRIERSDGRISAASVSFISLQNEVPLEVVESGRS